MTKEEFFNQLDIALKTKHDWFDSQCFSKILTQYRLLHSCVKNLYELYVQRSLIVPDPYRLDKKISQVVVPPSAIFTDPEMPKVFGTRFSDYEIMLDFICTYYHFSIDSMKTSDVKKLIEFNKFIDWHRISETNSKVNTRAFAIVTSKARSSASSVVLSLITDSLNKGAIAVDEINQALMELIAYFREFYKFEIRRDVLTNSDFNNEKANSSVEDEITEIKRVFQKMYGNKKQYFSDLITEIAEEDIGSECEKRRNDILAKFKIIKVEEVKKVKNEPNIKELLDSAVLSLGIIAQPLDILIKKTQENLELLFQPKKSIWKMFIQSLRKAFNLKEKEKIILLPIKDAKTNTEKKQKININEFLDDLQRKEGIYNGIGNRGSEFKRIENSPETAVMTFLNKQISEIQNVFTILNALDFYFKAQIDSSLRQRIRGMQIELSSLRNAIINVNKKRGEFVSQKEESTQLKKLGIKDEE